jgi:hypothetical protein
LQSTAGLIGCLMSCGLLVPAMSISCAALPRHELPVEPDAMAEALAAWTLARRWKTRRLPSSADVARALTAVTR